MECGSTPENAWQTWHDSISKQKIVVQVFRDTKITLPIMDLLKIKVFVPGELTVGDWTRYETDI